MGKDFFSWREVSELLNPGMLMFHARSERGRQDTHYRGHIYTHTHTLAVYQGVAEGQWVPEYWTSDELPVGTMTSPPTQ